MPITFTVTLPLDAESMNLLRLLFPQTPAPPDLVEFLSRIEAKLSQLSDAIAALSASTDAAVSRVQTDVTALKAQIATLQAQVDAGTASPADMQALADLKAKIDAIDPTNPATIPPAPETPPVPDQPPA